MSDVFAEYIAVCEHDFLELEDRFGWVKCKVCGVVAKKE
jgi:hypothetical protein